jgi:cold shock CspA family protein
VDVFVHYSSITGSGAPFLTPGDQVAFFLEQTVRGPQATDVARLN